MDINEKALNKIKKLHALSFSDKVGESVAARLAMNKLLVQHGIALDDIKSFDIEDNELLQANVNGDNKKRKTNVDTLIMRILNRFFFVTCFYTSWVNLGYEISIVGRKKDVELAKYVQSFLMVEFKKSLKEIRKTCKVDKYSYSKGFFEGLYEKLELERNKVQEEGLLIIDNKDEREEKITNDLGKLKVLQPRRNNFNFASYSKGLVDGNKVSITPALT